MQRIRVLLFLVAAFACSAGIARADVLEQRQSFFVNAVYDGTGASSIPATLRAVGQHGYFYVDDRYWDSLAAQQQVAFSNALGALAGQFDSVIYPKSVAFWGSENTPGIDNDPHVVILLERLISGSGGYFQTVNNYPASIAPGSNAREMIYVGAESVLAGDARDFAAHEFQHLISFNQKELLRNVSDDVWLNEARSEYNIAVDGYDDPFNGSTFQRRVQSFLRSPSDSLTLWPNTPSDYAIASVFAHYLANRFSPDILASTLRTSAAGTAAIDAWLTGHGDTERFGDVFTDWMADAYLHLPLTPTGTALLSGDRVDITASLSEWQPAWLAVNLAAARPLPDQISVQVADTNLRGVALAAYQDGTVQTIPLTAPISTAKLVFLTAALTRSPSAETMVAAPPATLVDGDLIRRIGQQETYVIWGPYRRYLSPGTLQLYGFQTRTVHEVSDDVFFQYLSSNYIREVGQQKVYAVWPDPASTRLGEAGNTKHWLNITPTQWDASHRDWGAIFTVNGAEVASYQTGKDVVY